MLLKIFAPLNALLSERSVEDADEPEPEVKHVPFTAKHPVAIEIPFANVDVAFPVTANAPVVVAFVVVAFTPVKFWSVVEPFARSCWKEETAVVEVATKRFATTPEAPATARDVYGEVVPIPTLPLFATVNAEFPPV